MASGDSEACYVNAEILAGWGDHFPLLPPSTTGTGPVISPRSPKPAKNKKGVMGHNPNLKQHTGTYALLMG